MPNQSIVLILPGGFKDCYKVTANNLDSFMASLKEDMKDHIPEEFLVQYNLTEKPRDLILLDSDDAFKEFHEELGHSNTYELIVKQTQRRTQREELIERIEDVARKAVQKNAAALKVASKNMMQAAIKKALKDVLGEDLKGIAEEARNEELRSMAEAAVKEVS